MLNKIEVINEKEVPFFENVKEVYERFELQPNNSPNMPVVFANRIIKNTDNKTYSYAVFVDNRDYEYFYNRIVSVAPYNNSIVKSIALLDAYHQKYGKELQPKVIESLNNSEEYINDDNNIWYLLGHYSEKTLTRKIKR